MMMAGMHFMGDVPFSWVFVHGIVRDAQGRKMSKSLGNVIDPLDLMDRYGTDALRFMLAEHATGQDIFLHEEWTAGARNFANKLWNVSRFVIMNLDERPRTLEPPALDGLGTADRWILSRLASTIAEVTTSLEGFELSVAARSLYSFVWNEFCDWYVEVAKLALREEATRQKDAAQQVLRFVLESVLRLLHPFMPFITEEIWQRMPGPSPSDASIMRAPWPAVLPPLINPTAEEDFDRVREVVSAIRSFRADHHVESDAKMRVHLSTQDASVAASLHRQQATIASLGRVQEVSLEETAEAAGPATRLVSGPVDIVIPLEGVLDLDAERSRLGKALEKVRSEIERFSGKLANEGFRAKAPAEVVAGEQHKLDEARATEEKLRTQLAEIGG
jgi:valyl-tRNA synthetase